MRLGWRNSRPNDFQGPDSRPLRDTFSELQRFMTWPHFHVSIDAAQAVPLAYGPLTITPIDDPYQLVRATTDRIQVPSTFDTWLLVAFYRLYVTTAVGRHLLGAQVNGATVASLIHETHAAHALAVRNTFAFQLPVKRGDYFNVAAVVPAAADVVEGFATGYFLPMT